MLLPKPSKPSKPSKACSPSSESTAVSSPAHKPAVKPRDSLTVKAVDAWFASRGWRPNAFQRGVWSAIAQGQSGLLHATTGSGKTYAVWLGILMRFMAPAPAKRAQAAPKNIAPKRSVAASPLTVIWITPMRALAADTLGALQLVLDALQAGGTFEPWSLGARSGDTPAAERSAQNKRLPTVLVTTPESLSVMLSRADAREALGSVKMVVVDEWHELLGNKRGVQTQLVLARLRQWNAQLLTWGMSATLGNLDEAMHTLLGNTPTPGTLVQGQTPKKLIIDSLLPTEISRFPWSGHLGLRMLPQVIDEISGSSTTLVFTNTRSQAEIWYQALLQARPDWAGVIALHHGSLDRGVREWVEAGLKNGELRAVVCTSSLDLGVDFLPVERVLQIGSPKGVARLLQRAGRSGHAPGRPSRLTLVPTHSLDMVEAAAARAAVAAGKIETRGTPEQPLDVLVQHLVTVALGGGFVPDALYEEVRGAAAYADLSRDDWDWCLSFVQQGGLSLSAYPDYRRAVPDDAGVWRVPDARLARRHRMNIGTIVSEASMAVQYVGGAKIGSVEESFAARLKPGDCFMFGGRLLALVRIHDMTAWVRRSTGKRAAVPRWSGGRMPLSSTLADGLVQQLALAADGRFDCPELQCVRPLLELQQSWSALPTPHTLLAEVLQTREGTHLFVYPFAGRHVHLGLASLIAWRVAQQKPLTFSMAVNDYGFELLCAGEVDWPACLPGALDCEAPLLQDVLASLNASELAQRRFREIARVSGLVFQGYPGEKRSNKQLQASSSLFYDVFRKYDPTNRLLLQAQHEVLAQELEVGRLRSSLERMQAQQLVLKPLSRPTPFAFALMVERFREQLSSESVADRIARMVQQLEKAAGLPSGGADAPVDAAGSAELAEPTELAVAEVRAALAFGQDTLAAPPKRPPRRSTRRKLS